MQVRTEPADYPPVAVQAVAPIVVHALEANKRPIGYAPWPKDKKRKRKKRKR